MTRQHEEAQQHLIQKKGLYTEQNLPSIILYWHRILLFTLITLTSVRYGQSIALETRKILVTVHLLVSHSHTPPLEERIQIIVLFKNATLIFIQITILISAASVDVLLPMLSFPYDDCTLKKTNKQTKGKRKAKWAQAVQINKQGPS